MEKQFVPYELALKLKELGFNGKCEATWRQNTEIEWYDPRKGEEIILGNKNIFLRTYIYLGKDDTIKLCDAPLWQQAFDWFHKEYNLFAEFSFNTLRNKYDWCVPVNINKGYCSQEEYDTYEEARLECLKKLIELVEN